MATPADPVASALERWRNNLIDLTRRNPLLHLRPNRTSYLEIAQPDWRQVHERLLAQGKPWLFHLSPEPVKNSKKPGKASEPRPNELVTSELERDDLVRILT